MKELKVNNWIITENAGSDFYACNGGESIHFTAEYKNGTYFKILSYYDMYTKRCYTAARYHYKLIPLVQRFTWELLKNDMLWDYKNQTTALETYKKDIYPYYKKCKENNLSLYKDEEFLNSLFN